MPLPAIRRGTTLRCTAKTRSRNLEQCLCPAAYGTTVCTRHGAVPLNKRPKGKSNGNYKHGNYTKDNLKDQSGQIAVLRNLENVLIVVGAIEGNPSKGRRPEKYENIKTFEHATNYLVELEEKNKNP